MNTNESIRDYIWNNPFAFMFFLENHLRENKKKNTFCLSCSKELIGRLYFCAGLDCSNKFIEDHASDLVEMITQ